MSGTSVAAEREIDRNLFVTVSGPPGCGDDAGGGIAAALDCGYVSGGELFREIAAERDMSLSQLIAKAGESEEIDRALDKRLRRIAEKWGPRTRPSSSNRGSPAGSPATAPTSDLARRARRGARRPYPRPRRDDLGDAGPRGDRRAALPVVLRDRSVRPLHLRSGDQHRSLEHQATTLDLALTAIEGTTWSPTRGVRHARLRDLVGGGDSAG